MESSLIILIVNYFNVIFCSTFFDKGIRYRENRFYRLLFILNKNTQVPVSLLLLQMIHMCCVAAILGLQDQSSALRRAIDFFVVAEFILIFILSIFLSLRRAIKEQKISLHIFLKCAIILIIFFDMAGAVNIWLLKEKYSSVTGFDAWAKWYFFSTPVLAVSALILLIRKYLGNSGNRGKGR